MEVYEVPTVRDLGSVPELTKGRPEISTFDFPLGTNLVCSSGCV